MGGWPLGYLHNAVEELNSGLPRTNPDSSGVEDLNQGPPDIKSSALNHSTTLPPIDVCIGYLCGIVHLIQNLLIHFTTLKYPYSDIGGDIEESDSATASVITVCEESTMPVRVYAEVSSTGEGGRKQSLCCPIAPSLDTRRSHWYIG